MGFICKNRFPKFNLLSSGLIEKFWDALWLGIRATLCFMCKIIDFLKFNLLSNGLIEKFWDALWLGIGPFLCLTEETLDRAGTDAPHHQPRVGQDCANMMSQFRRFCPPHHTCVGSMCHIIAIFFPHHRKFY